MSYKIQQPCNISVVPENLLDDNSFSTYYFDTNAINILSSINNNDLDRLINRFSNQGSLDHLLTLFHVEMEFSRTNNSKVLESRLNFKEKYLDLVPFRKTKAQLQTARSVYTVINGLGANPSPIDTLLATEVVEFSQSESSSVYLVTEDVKDFPIPIFERVGHIIIDFNRASRNLSVLQANYRAYEKEIRNISA